MCVCVCCLETSKSFAASKNEFMTSAKVQGGYDLPGVRLSVSVSNFT